MFKIQQLFCQKRVRLVTNKNCYFPRDPIALDFFKVRLIGLVDSNFFWCWCLLLFFYLSVGPCGFQLGAELHWLSRARRSPTLGIRTSEKCCFKTGLLLIDVRTEEKGLLSAQRITGSVLKLFRQQLRKETGDLGRDSKWRPPGPRQNGFPPSDVACESSTWCQFGEHPLSLIFCHGHGFESRFFALLRWPRKVY